jgi:hypothetical protein
MMDILIESNNDVDNLLGKLKAFTNNKEGSRNIGSAVNAMLAYNVLNTFKVKLRDTYTITDSEDKKEEIPFNKFMFGGIEFNTYENTKSYNFDSKKFDGPRIAGIISTLVSAMTDNAKERLAAKLGLNIEALGYVSNMVALGVPLKSAVMYMSQPIIIDYFKEIKAAESRLKALDEKDKISKSKILKEMISSFKSDLPEDFEKINLNDDLLAENIKTEGTNIELEYSILVDFSIIVEQTKYFNKIAQVLKLTKGLGTSWENKAKIDQNITELGLRMTSDEFDQSQIPIDLRQVFLGINSNKPYHKFMKIYIDISDQIEYLSKTIFIEKTDVFNKMVTLISNNFSIRYDAAENFYVGLKRDIVSYLSIKAYMKKLKDTGKFGALNSLHNGLIYDAIAEKKDPATFVDIVRTMNIIRQTLPDNYLANNFLNVLRTFKVNYETGDIDYNEYNKDGINKVESNTWAKLSEYQQEKLLDSFIEIYQNDELRQSGLATALFHYLLVKDGGQFKSGSFIKYIPNFMFKTLMDSSKEANEVLYKDDTNTVKEEYKKIFDMTLEEMLNDFLNIYTSSIANEVFIKPLLNRKIEKVNIYAETASEIAEIEKALKDHNPEQAVKFYDDKIVINMYAGVRDFMVPFDNGKKIVMIKNPKLKEPLTNIEKAKANKNLEYIKSKGFVVEATKIKIKDEDKKVLRILLPIEITAFTPETKDNKKKKQFYRLYSVNRTRKSDKEFSNPLELIDIENGEFIAKGVKATYVVIDKRGSKKQTKLAHMFPGQLPKTGQLPGTINKSLDNFVGFNPEYNETDEENEMYEGEDVNVKEVAKNKLNLSNIMKKLAAFGIEVYFKKGKPAYRGEVWDGISDDVKKQIKSHKDLLRILGDESITLYDEDEATTSITKTNKKVVVNKKPSKKTVFEKADELPYIEQNFNNDPKDYSRGSYKSYTSGKWVNRKVLKNIASKINKKIISSMDMIKAGLRTRTTRTQSWMNDLMDRIGVESPKSLVGIVIKQVDQHTGEYVYTRITSVNKFTKAYQDETWELEGWDKSVTDILLNQKNSDGKKRYAWVIEFEVVKQNKTPYKGVEKIIAGMQTGIDTQVGLDAGVELGLKTGGTAPKDFKTEEGNRPQLAKQYNVKEEDDRYVKLVDKLKEEWSSYSDTKWYDSYYRRNVYNILDSDATVIYADDVESTGTKATIDMLKAFKKKYIVNPTAAQLSEFLQKNEVRILNVAGNRASKLGATEKIANQKISKYKKSLIDAIKSLNSSYVNSQIEYMETDEEIDYEEDYTEEQEFDEEDMADDENDFEDDEEEDDDDEPPFTPPPSFPKNGSGTRLDPFAMLEEMSKGKIDESLWMDVGNVDENLTIEEILKQKEEESKKCNKKNNQNEL